MAFIVVHDPSGQLPGFRFELDEPTRKAHHAQHRELGTRAAGVAAAAARLERLVTGPTDGEARAEKDR